MICAKCKNDLAEDSFYKRKANKNGLNGTCKDCKRKQDKIYREKGRQKRAAYSKQWRLRNKERLRKYNKEYRTEHLQKSREESKKYYYQHIERLRSQDKIRQIKVRDSRRYDIKSMAISLYSSIYARTRGYAGRNSKYVGLPYPTRKEFIKFAENSQQLKDLMIRWQNSLFEPRFAPTVDRIINEKGYALDNIQFLSRSENSIKK
jgi:hypothetical protein